MSWTAVLASFVLAPQICSSQSCADSRASRVRQEERHARVTVKVELNYLLYLPPDYDRKNKWPLLLFLHGAGERGEKLSLVKRHGPPKLIAQGKDFPFVVVSPQCPKGRWWEPFELTVLLDHIVANYKIDEERMYVTGLSMGGFGTWALAAYTPDRFAALVPICGGGEPLWAARLKHLPVWVFHGAKDRVVPPSRSEQMVKALQAVGAAVRFTLYPDAGHDAWSETYNNSELYQWLLRQKRKRTE